MFNAWIELENSINAAVNRTNKLLNEITTDIEKTKAELIETSARLELIEKRLGILNKDDE